jgi:hypothetical protein
VTRTRPKRSPFTASYGCSRLASSGAACRYSSGRKGEPLNVFERKMDEKNRLLRAKGHAQLILVEVIGTRLYTGPMFEKYNLVLRFFTGKDQYTAEELGGKGTDGLPYLLKQCARHEPTAPRPLCLRCCACHGRCESFFLGVWEEGHDGSLRWAWINKCAQTTLHPTRSLPPPPSAARRHTTCPTARRHRYPTTIHGINSCILKLSKLVKACAVYRGLNAATLPDSFFTPNEDGVCGGIE